MSKLFKLCLALVALAGAGFAAAGLAHAQSDAQQQQQRRLDQPGNNAPLAAEQRGGSWTKGNRASWESQIKNRQLAQHEHKRIYQ